MPVQRHQLENDGWPHLPKLSGRFPGNKSLKTISRADKKLTVKVNRAPGAQLYLSIL
jgi:hypothetical protein